MRSSGVLVLMLATLACAHSTIYHLTATDIHNNRVSFSQYRGQVLVIANVASECGFTKSGYAGLAYLSQVYGTRGLVTLAFPCNQFGAQEPGSNEEIKAFIKSMRADVQIFQKTGFLNMHVSFDLFLSK
eukprot:m.751145 g.751145  ORF g.751145 m.751145 type:complete len:129 (-) comp58982_c0_seq38:1849-2235(-)